MAGRSLFHVALLLLHLVALASAMAPYDLLTGIEGTPDHEYCDEYRELIQWCTLIKINTTLLSDPEKGASVRVPDDDVVVLGRMTEVLKGAAGQTQLTYVGSGGRTALVTFLQAPGAKYEYIYGYVLFDKDMRDIGSILTSESGKKHFIRWKKIISALHKEEEEEEKEEQEEPERQVPEKEL